MRKVLLTLLFSCICYTLLSQFSIGIDGGVGSTRRDIPEGRIQERPFGGIALDIEYKFDSIPIVLNLSPYYITESRFEQIVLPQLIVSLYKPEIVIMSGLGTSASVSKYIQLFASLQFGYWHTKTVTTVYPGENQYKEDKIFRNLNQFSCGPKVRLSLGKRRLKAIFEYEDYLLSRNPEPYSGLDRFTRISVGLLYRFK